MQRPSRTARWQCKRRFGLLFSIHRAKFICVTNDGRKSNGCHSKDAQDKQPMQCQLTPRSKCKMHHRYWKFQSQNVHVLGYVCQNTNGLNRGPAWKTQSFLLSEICTVILWQDSYGNGNSRKFYWNTVGEKVPNWERVFVNREKGLFLSMYVDDIKLAGKKQHNDPMWKVPMKEVDLGEPTSFLEHVYLGCTQLESRDEWNNPLHLFNISIFSSASCPEAMSKRMQQGTGEERIVAKSKPTSNLVSHTAASSSTAPSSSASIRTEILRAPSQQGSNLMAQCAGKPAAGGSNQNDATSSPQVWPTNAKTNDSARKLVAAGTNQDVSFQEGARKLAAENSEINDEDDSKCPHSLRVSRANVPHLENVYSNLRRQLKRKPEDKMEDFDVNTLIWRMFMIVTLQAAVHLGNDCLVDLHSTKNQP